jgi:hypothetical protein
LLILAPQGQAWRENREFYQPEFKSSPDGIFGIHGHDLTAFLDQAL